MEGKRGGEAKEEKGGERGDRRREGRGGLSGNVEEEAFCLKTAPEDSVPRAPARASPLDSSGDFCPPDRLIVHHHHQRV